MNRYSFPTFKRPVEIFAEPMLGDRIRISAKGKEYMKKAVAKGQMQPRVMEMHLNRIGSYVEISSTEIDKTRARVVWDDDDSETRQRTYWPLEYLEKA